jgi:hypothetical protein
MTPSRCGVYSFPKSGNTWARIFLTSLFKAEKAIKVVPDIYEGKIDGAPVTAGNGELWQFYKSHAREEVVTFNGTPIENNLIVFMIRNPLDVFCSQLNYVAKGFVNDRGGIQIPFESAEQARDTGRIQELFSAFTAFGTLTPRFLDAGSWMENSRYWLDRAANNDNVLVLRYENMLDDFVGETSPLAKYFGFTTEDIKAAYSATEPRTNDNGNFFWKKSQRTYLEFLNPAQVERFCQIHEEVLKLSGYQDYY